MKNQAQPQVTLAGAEGGSGLLELDIPPDARSIAFGAVGALKVDAVIHRSPGSFAPANVQLELSGRAARGLPYWFPRRDSDPAAADSPLDGASVLSGSIKN